MKRSTGKKSDWIYPGTPVKTESCRCGLVLSPSISVPVLSDLRCFQRVTINQVKGRSPPHTNKEPPTIRNQVIDWKTVPIRKSWEREYHNPSLRAAISW